jgi:hypothetical protein
VDAWQSMLPKKVMWFKMAEEEERTIQAVAAEKEGDGYVLRFGGVCAAFFLPQYSNGRDADCLRQAID